MHVLWLTVGALIIDAILGDPSSIYRRLPHPVVWLGRFVSWGETRLNQPSFSSVRSFWLGGGLCIGVLAVTAGVAWQIHQWCSALPYGWLLEMLVASTLIAARSLYQHVRAVQKGLDEDLQSGRLAVSQIVGRDPQTLNEAGVARAAIESVAENFSDGVVAPVFWCAVFGLPGLAVYKAINTLDSMIGHRNERYEYFGKFAARLDDIANWLPARLAGLAFCVAAIFHPVASPKNALRTVWRDANRHRSVNAGWQEAAVAGALQFALAGPRVYGAQTIDDAWMGNGRSDLTADDIGAALHLYVIACVCVGVAVTFAAFWFA